MKNGKIVITNRDIVKARNRNDQVRRETELHPRVSKKSPVRRTKIIVIQCLIFQSLYFFHYFIYLILYTDRRSSTNINVKLAFIL